MTANALLELQRAIYCKPDKARGEVNFHQMVSPVFPGLQQDLVQEVDEGGELGGGNRRPDPNTELAYRGACSHSNITHFL